jgi:hypothetical protein
VVKRYGLLAILLVAAFWRFYNYPTRWVLNQDQARDATIALYSIRTGSLPLLGSPSSAGPFNFGPLYDYTIILFSRLLPFVSGPWVGFTLLNLLAVYLFYQIGSIINGQRLGLILALVSAFTSEFIFNSPDMLNTVIVAFGVTLSIFLALKLITTKRLKFALLLGLAAGFTLNNHFQALGMSILLILTPLFLSLPFPKKLLAYFLIGLGFTLTFLSPLIFDFTHQFVWIRSVITYYTVGVHKFWAPTSWRRDIFTFWPELSGNTLIGSPSLGYPIILFILVSHLPLLKNFKSYFLSHKSHFLLSLYFLTQVLLLRYYSGTRSREYLIAFEPLLVFFFGYSLFLISSFSKYFFIFFVSIFIVLSSLTNLKYLGNRSQTNLIYSLKSSLDSQIPGPVNLISNPSSNMVSLPIFYLLYRQNRISPSGTPVLACINCTYPDYKLLTSVNLSSTQSYFLYILPQNFTPTRPIYALSPSLIFSWLYINY